ncbi:MAG: hypothetical protein KAS71_15800, partial [Bacteroidales bacterium]|nr:hypothetical protein [Bacteroidales bacterium]
VDQVLEIEKEEILPPPSMGKKYKNAYIKGVFNVDDSFTMLLDLDSFFTTDELLQLADMKKDSDRVEELKKKKREKEKEKQKQK